MPDAERPSEEPSDAVASEDVRDELPDDLDATAFTVPETFPNNDRRRIPAVLYLVMGIAAIVFVLLDDGSPRVNTGLLIGGVVLVAFAVYGFVAGRTLAVDETEALAAVARTVGFPVGPAAAQLVWRGVWSRPVWRLLAFSGEDPPAQRAFAVVDGISGEVVEWFAEANPEATPKGTR